MGSVRKEEGEKEVLGIREEAGKKSRRLEIERKPGE